MSEINEIARQQASVFFSSYSAKNMDEKPSMFGPPANGVYNLYDNPAWWGSVRPMGLEVILGPLVDYWRGGSMEFRLCPTPERDSGVFFRITANLAKPPWWRDYDDTNYIPSPDWHYQSPFENTWAPPFSYGYILPVFSAPPQHLPVVPRAMQGYMELLVEFGNIGGVTQKRNLSLDAKSRRIQLGVFEEDGVGNDGPYCYFGSVNSDSHLELWATPTVSYRDPEGELVRSFVQLITTPATDHYDGSRLGNRSYTQDFTNLWGYWGPGLGVRMVRRYCVRYKRDPGYRLPGREVLIAPPYPDSGLYYPESIDRAPTDDARSPHQTCKTWHIPTLGQSSYTDRETHHQFSAGIPVGGEAKHWPHAETERNALEYKIDIAGGEWHLSRFPSLWESVGNVMPGGLSPSAIPVYLSDDEAISLAPPDSPITTYVLLPSKAEEKDYQITLPPAASVGNGEPPAASVGDGEPPKFVRITIDPVFVPDFWDFRRASSLKLLLPDGSEFEFPEGWDNRPGDTLAMTWDSDAGTYVLWSAVNGSVSVSPHFYQFTGEWRTAANTDGEGRFLSPGCFYASHLEEDFADKPRLYEDYMSRSRFNDGTIFHKSELYKLDWVTLQNTFYRQTAVALGSYKPPGGNWVLFGAPADQSFEIVAASYDPPVESLAVEIMAAWSSYWSAGTPADFSSFPPVPQVFSEPVNVFFDISDVSQPFFYSVLGSSQGRVADGVWTNNGHPFESGEKSIGPGPAPLFSTLTYRREWMTTGVQAEFSVSPHHTLVENKMPWDWGRSQKSFPLLNVGETDATQTGIGNAHDEYLSGQHDLIASGGTQQKLAYVQAEKLVVRGRLRICYRDKYRDIRRHGVVVAKADITLPGMRYAVDTTGTSEIFRSLSGSPYESTRVVEQHYEETFSKLVCFPKQPWDAANSTPPPLLDDETGIGWYGTGVTIPADSVSVVAESEPQDLDEGQDVWGAAVTADYTLVAYLSAEKTAALKEGNEIELTLRDTFYLTGPDDGEREDICWIYPGAPTTSLSAANISPSIYKSPNQQTVPTQTGFRNSTINFRLV